MNIRLLPVIVAVVLSALPSSVAAAEDGGSISGLSRKLFDRYWRIESESPDYRISFSDDTCEITAPKGLTLWRRDKMTKDMTVEYDVCIMAEREDDRVSDMNAFWLASDPAAKDIWQKADWRSGIFLRCYTLQMYYLGFGGNYNTTTRFRRYDGDERAVENAALRPAILKEYTDSAHLLKGNHWYHIRISSAKGHNRFYVDGEQIVDYADPQQLEEGWFGFRSTLSRFRITSFRCYKNDTGERHIPLHWIGGTPDRATPVSFGIPFAKGELTDVSRLAFDADSIGIDAWVNARWPDESVKWAGVTAFLPPGYDSPRIVINDAAKKRSGRKRRDAAKDKKIVIETLDDTFVVNTGKIRTTINRMGRFFIESISTDKEVGRKGRLVASTEDGRKEYFSDIDSVVVERSGNIGAVIKCCGSYSDGSRQWLPFILRLYFYAGSERIKMVHSFVFDGNEEKDLISSIGIRFEVPMREEAYNRHIAFACDRYDGDTFGVWSEAVQPLDSRRRLGGRNGNLLARQANGMRIIAADSLDDRDRFLIAQLAQWDGYRLSQTTDNSFSIRKRATSVSPWIGTFTGVRSAGTAFVGDISGGMVFSLKNFWQTYPSSIEINRARSDAAETTVWLWSPEAEAMNLCHYDTVAHSLEASYEDVQKGLSSPYGIAHTDVVWIAASSGYTGKEDFSSEAAALTDDYLLQPTPEYLHDKQAFGIWSLPDSSTITSRKTEERLRQYLDFYRKAVEENKWYGYWNYGDIMHAYSPERHSWRYDVGGYAWDNTELASPLWLWYSFLRTGDASIFRMAEAMTRHNGEVDSYHIGDLAGLGSRHNVVHWGCGAKEARISQAAFNRIFYYLTTDERTGDLIDEVRDADQKLYSLDPMRLAEPKSKYPCSAPARLRIGPDWLAYAGNWLAAWERYGDTKYKDKIIAGMKSIARLRHGVFTGNKALGYDPATGVITFEGDSALQNTNHLMTIMGGFETMNEILQMTEDKDFERMWTENAAVYKQKAREISNNHFPVRRWMAYAAYKKRNAKLKNEVWDDLWHRIEHQEAPRFEVKTVIPPLVPAPMTEWRGISTNDAALWSLDAIYMLEVINW